MSCRAKAGLALAFSLFAFACSSGTKYIGSNAAPGECGAPEPPPPELGLDSYYERYVNANGIPVVSSANVSDEALARGCAAAVHLLGKRADVHARLVQNGFRLAVIGIDEVLTGLPEYSDLATLNPNVDWDYAVRSVGASSARPVSSVGEENLLCLSDDLFVGESIAVHSLAHGLRSQGILDVDPDWDDRLRAAYDAALASDLWTETYAATEPSQYWAEGVQSWYDTNIEVTPPDGLHNAINTRSELKAYDPELASLIAEHVPDDAWRPSCAATP